MKNSRPIQSKIMTTVFAIAALLLQPIVALNVPSALAADTQTTNAVAAPTDLHYIDKITGKRLECGLTTNKKIVYPTWTYDNSSDDFTKYEYQSFAGGTNTTNLPGNQFVHNWTPGSDMKDGFRVRAVTSEGASEWTDYCYVDYLLSRPLPPVIKAEGFETGNFSNKRDITIEWPAVDGAVRYIYSYWNDIEKSYSQENPWSPEPFASTSMSGVFNQGEGTHYMQVVAVDAAGKQSDPSNVFVVKYDSVVPVTSLVASNPDPAIGEKVTVTGSVIEKNLASHQFQVTTPKGVSYIVDLDAAQSSPSFVLDTAEGAGTYTIRYVATDLAGNKNDDTTPLLVVVKKPTLVYTPVFVEQTEEPKVEEKTTKTTSEQPAILLGYGAGALTRPVGRDILSAEDNQMTKAAKQSVLENADNLAAVAGDQTKAGFWEQLLNWWWVPAAILAVSILLWLIAAARRNKEEI